MHEASAANGDAASALRGLGHDIDPCPREEYARNIMAAAAEKKGTGEQGNAEAGDDDGDESQKRGWASRGS